MLSGLVLCCLLALSAAAPGPFGNDTEPLGNRGNQDIINGRHTRYGFFNYVLLLKRNGQFICGASLISSTRALTAGHCVSSSGTYQVVAGELVRNLTSGYEVERTATSIVKHPNYVNFLKDDIAILKFSSIPNSQYIQPIPRYTDSDGNPTSKSCYIAGWGQVSGVSLVQQPLPQTDTHLVDPQLGEIGTGPTSNVLKYGDMKVITNTECRGEFGSIIGNYHVCAQKYSSNRGACSGDSGGPLECMVFGGTVKLLGVGSFTAKGCDTDYPSVYTDVVYYKSWIDSNM